MCTIGAIEQSTYRTSYRGELPSLPNIKYKRLPCLYTESAGYFDAERSHRPVPLTRAKRPVLQPPTVTKETVINLDVRPTSARKNVAFRNKVFDTKFGPMDSATIDALYNKRRYSTNTQSAGEEYALPYSRVFDTKFGPMDSATIDALYNKRRYSTNTQSAGEECALPYSRPEPPKTTQEPKADMVRLRGQRYDDAPYSWQDAILWDRIQSRPITQGSGNIPGSPTRRDTRKLLQKRQQNTQKDEGKYDKIVNLVKNDGLANVFVRKCPGYAGYIPLCPPETRLDDKKIQNDVSSLMTSSYSKFPDHLYKNPVHAKKGIFSKTVTLTSPLNPYNKIGQEKRVDNECQYTNMKDYLDVLHGETLKFV